MLSAKPQWGSQCNAGLHQVLMETGISHSKHFSLQKWEMLRCNISQRLRNDAEKNLICSILSEAAPDVLLLVFPHALRRCCAQRCKLINEYQTFLSSNDFPKRRYPFLAHCLWSVSVRQVSCSPQHTMTTHRWKQQQKTPDMSRTQRKTLPTRQRESYMSNQHISERQRDKPKCETTSTHVRPQPGPSDWLLPPGCCSLDRSMCSTYVWIIWGTTHFTFRTVTKLKL